MEYKIKQRQIKKMFEIDKLFVEDVNDMRKSTEMMKNMTLEQRTYKFLMGYLKSLSDALEYRSDSIKLDLTYDTIANLFTSVAALFMLQKNHNFETDKNIQTIEKAIAAYFILLAINEHNVAINITPKNYLGGWSGCNIVLEKSGKKADFLNDISGKAYFSNNKLTIYAKGLMESFKNLTGKDLEECGLDDVEIDLA